MGSLEYRYQNVRQTLSTLETALKLIEDPHYEEFTKVYEIQLFNALNILSIHFGNLSKYTFMKSIRSFSKRLPHEKPSEVR